MSFHFLLVSTVFYENLAKILLFPCWNFYYICIRLLDIFQQGTDPLFSFSFLIFLFLLQYGLFLLTHLQILSSFLSLCPICDWSHYLSCCYRLPQTNGLKTTEIYSLTGLEARNVKSRCQLCHVLPESSREEYLLATFSFG